MGIFNSKISPAEIKVPELLNNQLQDPRSPTVNINRSPIGTCDAYDKPTITKVRDLTADLTEILDNTQTPVRPDNGGNSKLQSLLDPRSPSSFDRTPLVLSSGQHDESNASNIGLCGTSLEFEEISCGDNSATFNVVSETPSLFSDISLNTELKADIECIIQGLHDASGKDPRSPSINIQRTPIVFEEKEEEQQKEDEKDEAKQTEQIALDKSTPIVIHQDENAVAVAAAAAVTPIKEKLEALKVNSAPRTPLGCVTNVKKTPAAQHNMRKTALFGQMKQNANVVGSAEIAAKKPLQTRSSKIPTLRMK